jgi:hypothetical protein
MLRRLLALAVVAAMPLVLAVRADDADRPKSGDPKLSSIKAEAALKQEILSRQFKEFEQSLLRLAQRLNRSSKPEDREKAAVLMNAINLASKENVDVRFDKLVNILKTAKTIPSLQEVREAITESEQLAVNLRAMLEILLTDRRDLQLKDEEKRITELLKELNRIIRDEKIERAQVESGRGDKNDLHKSQKQITGNTERLAKAMGKGQGEGKEGKQGKEGSKEGKEGSKEGKEGKGTKEGKQGKEGSKEEKEGKEGKEGSKEGKQGKGTKEGKQGGKEGSPGEGKEGEPQSGSQQQQNMPGRENVQRAIQNQKRGEQNIQKDDRPEASKDLDKALQELEETRKKLEARLKQIREEEQERLLADLQRRCERMLQMQIEVYEGTVRVDKAIAENADKKPSRANEQKSLQLSDREGEIVREAGKALTLLEEEGTVVAFAEILKQVSDDMTNVQRRLGRVDVGQVTQVTEQDIIAMLKEMIEALKKAQQKLQANKGQPPPPRQGPPPPQSLIDLLAELRLIRSMQFRVNNRTEAYGKQYPGEQADAPEIQKELNGLAGRQSKIFDITKNIATGKNQ